VTWFCQTAWGEMGFVVLRSQLRRRWSDVGDENVCRFAETLGRESHFRTQFQSYVESLGRSPKRCSILRTSARGIRASIAMSSAAS
jgi:hypothetical protein